MGFQHQLQYKKKSSARMTYSVGEGAVLGVPRGGYDGRERVRTQGPIGQLSAPAARAQCRKLEAQLRKFRAPVYTFAQLNGIENRRALLEILQKLRAEAQERGL